MINKQQAIDLIRKELDDDMDIILDLIIEKEYGWVIYSQSKQYIKSKNANDMFIGSGGTLVEKSTGNKFEFGSAYSLEQNLKIYEKGYLKYDNWDLIVTRVNDLQRTIYALMKLGISYVVPEEAYGATWKVPQSYSKKQFKTKLSNLPVRFNLGNIYFQYDDIESIKREMDFIISLEENIGFVNNE